MKLNNDKCHFLTAANTHELLWIKVGDSSQKLSALTRIAKLLPFYRKRILLKTFIESQFSYCPFVWMFCTRKMNNKMNHIHERALRIVYSD